MDFFDPQSYYKETKHSGWVVAHCAQIYVILVGLLPCAAVFFSELLS